MKFTEPNVDFDWDSLFASCGEAEQITLDEAVRLATADALRRFLSELIGPYKPTPRHMRAISMRIIALAWVLDRRLVPGCRSMREVAIRSGCSERVLQRIAARFSRAIKGIS